MKKLYLYILSLLMMLSIIGFAENITLEQFLNKVEKNSKDLKLARKDLDMAKAQKKEAYSTALPKIFAQGEYKRNLKANYMYLDLPAEMSDAFPSKMKINYDNEFSFSTVLSQTLFSFKVGNAIKAARQFSHLTDHIYQAQYQGIITYAKKGFYQTLLLKKVWMVNVASARNAKENYENMKNKFDNGLISEFELLQSEVRWQNIIPQVTEAKRNYEIAIISMKDFAGIPQDTELELKGELAGFPPMPQFMELKSVLEVRPDYSALKWEEKLRTTNVKAQFSDYFPSLEGRFIYGYSAMSNEFKQERQNHALIAGVKLSIPIWTGGYTTAQVQKARIERDKTRIQIEKAKENVNRELENIKLRLTEAKNRIVSAEKTREIAKKAFRIAQSSADNGLATQLELKDTRVMSDQAELGYYAAILDYLVAYFDYELAVGKVKK